MIPHVGLGQTVAKIILLGEHSVVYGYPAIALPMHSLRMTARVEPVGPDAPSTLTGLGWSGPMQNAPSHFASILRARDVAVEFIGAPDAQMSITTQSEFPAQRGLGSSAAAAGAVIRAILDAYDAPARPEEIFTLTQEAETSRTRAPVRTRCHGDVREHTPVHFQAGRATELDLPLNAWIVIADSGIMGSTRETVGHVRSLYETSFHSTRESLSRLGKIADGAIADLRTGDIARLGIKMTESQGLLAELGVSTDQLDELVYAALDAGALGGKLTGGGGGGCVIALARTHEDARRIEEAMRTAGARATWIHAPILDEVVA